MKTLLILVASMFALGGCAAIQDTFCPTANAAPMETKSSTAPAAQQDGQVINKAIKE